MQQQIIHLILSDQCLRKCGSATYSFIAIEFQKIVIETYNFYIRKINVGFVFLLLLILLEVSLLALSKTCLDFQTNLSQHLKLEYHSHYSVARHSVTPDQQPKRNSHKKNKKTLEHTPLQRHVSRMLRSKWNHTYISKQGRLRPRRVAPSTAIES